MAVRMWATLPKDYSANGLGAIEKALLDDPETEHVIVARINRKRVTTDDDTRETTPTARVVHIEVMTDPQASENALKLLGRAHKDRTGEDTLPYPDSDE